MPNNINLIERSGPFLAYLEEWYNTLTDLPLEELIGGEPERVALISIDIINGFCKSGPLASERVGRLAQPIAELFERAYALGVRNLALTQDTHDPQTPEFQAYPPHCIRGTAESEAVDELKALPFFDDVAVFPKNSINSHLGTGLGTWVQRTSADRSLRGRRRLLGPLHLPGRDAAAAGGQRWQSGPPRDRPSRRGRHFRYAGVSGAPARHYGP